MEVGRVIVIRTYRGEPIARFPRISQCANQQTFFTQSPSSIFYSYSNNARKSKLLYFYSLLNLLKREPRGPRSALQLFLWDLSPQIAYFYPFEHPDMPRLGLRLTQWAEILVLARGFMPG